MEPPKALPCTFLALPDTTLAFPALRWRFLALPCCSFGPFFSACLHFGGRGEGFRAGDSFDWDHESVSMKGMETFCGVKNASFPRPRNCRQTMLPDLIVAPTPQTTCF